MCAGVEIIGAAIFVAMLAVTIIGCVHETRLVNLVETHHPQLWRELGVRAKWFLPEDQNYSYAGVQWYVILLGQYKEIPDPRAHHLGRIARAWSLTALVLFAALGVLVIARQEFPQLGCLLIWRPLT